MNYQDLYLDTISKLKSNQRPLIKLTPELMFELKTEWQKIILETMIDEKNLLKILCILDNTQNQSREFNELFLSTLEKVTNDQILIHTLGACQKHIISESLKSGDMIPAAFFLHLKNNLKTRNPEVLEWTLRTIESMGPLSLRLKKEVQMIKPGFFKFINPHQKSSFLIIELLEKQWEKYER